MIKVIKKASRSNSLNRCSRSRSRSPTSKPSFKEGDHVEANYRGKGRYYPGKIRRDNRDGTYDIDYDDGEKERSVKEADIKSNPNIFRRGDKVEVNHLGLVRYYTAGKIREDRGDGTFDIDYDDGEKENRVREDMIRESDGVLSARDFQ